MIKSLIVRQHCRQRISSLLSLTPSSSTIGKGVADGRLISRSFSSTQIEKKVEKVETKNADNPGKFVQGLTKEMLENDPIIAEFFHANFPDDESMVDPYGDHLLDEFLGPYYKKQEEEERLRKEEELKNTNPKIYHQLEISDELAALNIRPLITYNRNSNRRKTFHGGELVPGGRDGEKGTRPCKEMRREQKMIPGLIYGNDPTRGIQGKPESSKHYVKTRWKFLQRELDLFHYLDFVGRVYELTLYDNEQSKEYIDKQLVVPTDLQMHPIKNKYYCCNYLRYYPGRPLKIPIKYINEDESPAMKSGRYGFIAPVNKHIEVVVEEGVPIPEHIELDCTDLKVKDVVRFPRLTFPDGVSPSPRLRKPVENFLIGTVFGSKRLEMGLDGKPIVDSTGDETAAAGGATDASGGSGEGGEKKEGGDGKKD